MKDERALAFAVLGENIGRQRGGDFAFGVRLAAATGTVG